MLERNWGIMKRSALLFTVFALVAASSASAYVLLSPIRTWDSSPTYIVDNRGHASITDNDGGVAATVGAIKAWGGVISAQAGSVSSWQLGDGVPMLNFQDPEHACNGNCLAATFTGFYEQRNDGSYRIFDADIVTSSRYDFTSTREDDGCSNEFFIEGVQTHEAGHGLGLGHSNVAGSTMFPSVAACDNGPASLAQDDKDGIQALYGGGGGSGGGGGGGGNCDLGQKGDACDSDADCCSGKCRGSGGNMTCK